MIRVSAPGTEQASGTFSSDRIGNKRPPEAVPRLLLRYSDGCWERPAVIKVSDLRQQKRIECQTFATSVSTTGSTCLTINHTRGYAIVTFRLAGSLPAPCTRRTEELSKGGTAGESGLTTWKSAAARSSENGISGQWDAALLSISRSFWLSEDAVGDMAVAFHAVTKSLRLKRSLSCLITLKPPTPRRPAWR